MTDSPPSAPSKPQSARLFFALWPDGKTRDALDQAARQLHGTCGGRRTKRATIHITLAFIGDVPLERIALLRELAGGISAPAFELALTKLGCWKHNRVAWAAPDTVPAGLADLVGRLEEALKQAAFKIDERPYLPHATLARKATCREAPLLPAAIVWDVKEFVLVRSVTDASGAAYEVIGRWPLMASG